MVPAGLRDDAVDGGEAEAGAVTLGLGGEEGLEDAVDRGLVHAGAGVRHAQPHVPARLQAGPAGGVGGVHVDVGRVDPELAAAWHRVPGVDGQVDQNLLDLARVRLDGPQILAGDDVEVDVLAERTWPMSESTGCSRSSEPAISWICCVLRSV